ncbi:hypothetical protein N9C35_03070 [Flavobacteriaceae bacterium]|nr:hypothetical protein [Flavobacteriaceae bacterium]
MTTKIDYINPITGNSNLNESVNNGYDLNRVHPVHNTIKPHTG